MSTGAIEKLIASVDNLATLIEKLTAKTAAAAGGNAPAAAGGKAPAAGADAGEEKPAGRRGRPAAPKALSPTEMAEKAKDFVESINDDEDEFKARRALVTKLAKKYDADKFSNIKDAKDQAAALAAIKAHVEEYDNGGDGGDGGEGDGDY